MAKPRKITIAEMRQFQERDIVAYCLDIVCTHRVFLNADALPGGLSLSDLEPKMRCAKCGKLGADIRPMYWVATPGCPKPSVKPWPVAAN